MLAQNDLVDEYSLHVYPIVLGGGNTAMTTSLEVRSSIVELFRRDLVGPSPQDDDLQNERLSELPSRWYLTGFLAPAEDPLGLDGEPEGEDASAQEEMEIGTEGADEDVELRYEA